MREKQTSEICKFLKKLRTDIGETQRDMPIRLGVSSTFLSAIENQRKKIPLEWYHKLCEMYSLNDKQKCELDRIMFFINNRTSIDLTIFSEYEKDSILERVYEIYKKA